MIEPIAVPISGVKPYSALQAGFSMTPSSVMNSWTRISPMSDLSRVLDHRDPTRREGICLEQKRQALADDRGRRYLGRRLPREPPERPREMRLVRVPRGECDVD